MTMPGFEVYSTRDNLITPKCHIHCQERQQKQQKQEKQDSSCQHTEDVCQHCLEKVQTTTEDSPQKKSPRGRTNREKANAILISGIGLAFSGFVAFWSAKILKGSLVEGVWLTKELLEAVTSPTRKE